MKKLPVEKILYTLGLIILLLPSIVVTIIHSTIVSSSNLHPVMFMDPVFLIMIFADALSKFIPLFIALELLGVNIILWIIGVWVNNKRYHRILPYLTWCCLIFLTIIIWHSLDRIVR